MPTVTPAAVINSMPALTFRLLTPVPCTDVSFDWSHDQIERRYAYVDGASHDWTGRAPIHVSATLLFLNTLEPELYPAAWRQWRHELFDGALGLLNHPDLGVINARVLNGSVKMGADSPAGITVQVAWVESRDNIDEAVTLSGPQADLDALAKQADKDAGVLKIKYPTGKNTTTIEGLINSVQGRIFSAQLAASGLIKRESATHDRILGAAVGTIRQIRDEVGKLNDTAAWALDHNLEAIENSPLDLRDAVGALAMPIQSKTITADTGLDDFAKSVGNSLVDVINLNTKYLGKPSVPRGSTLKFFAPI